VNQALSSASLKLTDVVNTVGDVDYSVPLGLAGRRLQVRVFWSEVVIFSEGDDAVAPACPQMWCCPPRFFQIKTLDDFDFTIRLTATDRPSARTRLPPRSPHRHLPGPTRNRKTYLPGASGLQAARRATGSPSPTPPNGSRPRKSLQPSRETQRQTGQPAASTQFSTGVGRRYWSSFGRCGRARLPDRPRDRVPQDREPSSQRSPEGARWQWQPALSCRTGG